MPYIHLTLNDCYAIYHLLLCKLSYREIGRRLGKHHTTISREVKRNWEYKYPYWHEAAQGEADARKHIARHTRKQSNKKLYNYVIHRLKKEWSPEIIVGCLKLDYPDDETMQISIEGI